MQDVKRARQRGLSLVELLVVVLIIGVVVATALPNILRTIELSKLETSVASVVSRLSDARMEAIKRNRDVSLLIDAGQNTMQVRTIDGLNIGPAEALPRGITIVAPPTPAQITFDPLGWPRVIATQTVTLRASTTEQRSVTITPTGRVRAN